MSNDFSKQNYTLLFVYGTLKQGMSRDINYLYEQNWMDLDKPRYIGTAKTTNNYNMYRLAAANDSFPGLVNSDESVGKEIYGELYEVSNSLMLKLDLIEGVKTGLYFKDYIQLNTKNLTNLPLHKESFDLLEKNKAVSYILKVNNIGELEECGVIWTT